MFLVVFYITIKITEYENVLIIPQNNPQNPSKTQIWTLCEAYMYLCTLIVKQPICSYCN